MAIEDYFEVQHVLPRMQWSFVASFSERLHPNGIVCPLQLLPFSTVNQSRTSIKLITADEVRAKRILIDLYLTPFDMLSWLGTSVLLIGGTSLVVTLLTNGRGYKSPWSMLKLGVFWLYSTLVEQPEDGNFSGSTTTSGAPRGILLTALFVCCVVNNVYRAFLNVGFTTGNEYGTKWEQVKQVQETVSDFILYMVANGCAWDDTEVGQEWGYDRSRADLTHFVCACTPGCLDQANDALCVFRRELDLVDYLAEKHEDCKFWPQEFLEGNKNSAEILQRCPMSRIRFFWKMNINLRFFSLDDLRSVIREELTKARTALVTTKDFLPAM